VRNLNDVIIINNSGTSSTAAIDTTNTLRGSAQAVFSDGAAAGSLKLQGSNDFTNAGNLPSNFVPTHWNDIPSTTQAVTAGATTLIPSTEFSYRWIRVTFVSTGGAGTITVLPNFLGY
jgi:hypothetical protein